MVGPSCIVACLALVTATADSVETQKAARSFERNMVIDETRAAKAQKDYENSQGEINRQAAHRASLTAAATQDAALTRRFKPTPKWGIELRFGPYRPALSSQSAAQDLYDLVFVSQDSSIFHGRPLQMGLEVDAYPFQQFGLLGVYGRVSYWRVTGPTRLCVDPSGAPLPCTATTVFASGTGADTAQFSIVPISAGAVWRVDLLRRFTAIPIQFNAKLGLDYHIWWGNSGDVSSTYQGHKAAGATLGYSVSVGAALGLEVFSGATLANRTSGVRNALFIEYEVVRGGALVGKNRRDRLDFTDNRLIIVGLSVDFN